ncbi:MAG: ABC transporter ATP-binding protein, partial [Erysipelotrichales bacterium]
KKEFPLAVFGTILTASVVLIELTQPKLMASIVDVAIPAKNLSMILDTGLRMGILAFLGAGLGVGGVICAALASDGFAKTLRHVLMAKIQTFSAKEMDGFGVSSLITRTTNDINFIQSTLLQSLRMLVRAPVMLVSAVVMAYFTNKTLSIVIFIAVAILSLMLFQLLSRGYPLFVGMQKALDKMNKNLQEGLINIRVIKSFVAEDKENKRFEITNENLMKASKKANSLMALLNPSLMLVLQASTLLVMGFGSRLILIDGQLKLGELLVFINYMMYTLNSMLMLSMTLTMFSRSKASFVRIAEILDMQPEIRNPADALRPTAVQGKISFHDVSFKYAEASSAYHLERLNFEVQAGEHIGIIGSTGSGKTTLIRCLTRLLDIDQGEIRLDDVSIHRLDLSYLRAMISVVPQKNVLFSGNIAQNLRWGNPDADEAKLWDAVRASGIEPFIRNSTLQLETSVQQGGINFSGGQKQRLCIARALVKDAPVLVFDDSMSALDAATEALVKQHLKESYAHKTILMIAQKISSIKDFDRILVLDEGKIIGYDTHTELLKSNRIYQEIVASQAQRGV